MRSYVIKSVGGGFVVLGLAALWADDAAAQDCGVETVYTPPRFTNGNPGDVALIGNSGSAASQALAPIAATLGMTYFHTSMVYSSIGQMTETYWNGIAPPSSSQTGEPHICSRVMSPWYLARLGPGAWAGWNDVVPANLVKGLRTTACTPVARGGTNPYGTKDTYHFNSFLHDDVPGGSCEKMLVDDCGIPVEYNTTAGGDRTVYNGSQFFSVVEAVWQEAYKNCEEVIGGSWPWEGVGCGGTGTTTACQRAAWQVVNEIVYKAQPLQPDAASDDGWSDFNSGNPSVWSGTMLGAGKTIWETEPTGGLCPGACNNGGCNNAPISCSAYAPATWVANVPDNIAHAAKRLNPNNSASLPGYTVAGVIAPGYNTTTTYPPCPSGESCTYEGNPGYYQTYGNCYTTCTDVNCRSPYTCINNTCEYETS
jgi:hypothetical protein